MYTIEYYKTKTIKPTLKQAKYKSDNQSLNRITKRKYLYQKDIIDKCWDIKSLTIDIEDIEKIIYDQSLINLYSLYAIVMKRISSDNSISSITILNNNFNLSYIYEIIKCKWMINANENIDEINIEKIQNRLDYLKNIYENTTNKKKEIDIEYKIYLITYYLDTIKKHYDMQKKDKKTVKLGKRFIKQKNNKNIL